MAAEEEDLREQLSKHQPQEPEYASLLDQLATLKITHGHVQEAQSLFKELASIRASQIKKEAVLCGQNAEPSGLTIKKQQEGGQPHLESRTESGCGEGGVGAGANAADDEDDDDGWEAKDWDQALESIRPGAPASPRLKATSQPPPLRKTPGPTAAELLAASSGQQKGGKNTKVAKAGKEHAEDEPHSAIHLEELDHAEVVTSWSGGFDHCVELGGLTSDVRTGDLQELLDSLLPDDAIKPYIRWVDDNHAVLVCANVTSANNLLDMATREGMIMCPFLEATQASKQLPVSELLPPKHRPKTSTAVARRLMSHALGLPGLRDRAGERDLAAARKQAREDRQAKQQAAQESMAAAWGDD